MNPADPESEPRYKRIAVTQPRKIACVSLAARVSTEMLCEKGTKVGYQVCNWMAYKYGFSSINVIT